MLNTYRTITIQTNNATEEQDDIVIKAIKETLKKLEETHPEIDTNCCEVYTDGGSFQ